jgi:hypothetical protein
MHWIGLLLGVLPGAVAAAYLSLVVELDRPIRNARQGADVGAVRTSA